VIAYEFTSVFYWRWWLISHQRWESHLRAALLVDEAVFDPEDPDFKKEPKKPWEAEFSVSHALRTLGHTVTGVPATVDISRTIHDITTAKPDFVFNLVEELGGSRDYDSLLVRILELMNTPYTGASADALTLSRNKHLAKLVVANAGVPVPKDVVIGRNMKYSLAGISFPLIVKPACSDGSEGINASSYVASPDALRRRIRQLLRQSQTILCEEYVPGREIIVTVSGITHVTIDSICELVFPQNSRITFATEMARFDRQYRTRTGIFYRTPTRLPKWLSDKVSALTKKAYQALRIESYAKIEFRVDGNRIVFLEANPNSQLSRFAHSTDFTSIGYEHFIKKIIQMALDRRHR
jgi:D-alanine-D-alanine ligase